MTRRRFCLEPSGRAAGGFTLIELMITVVIAAVLAAVALPSFVDSVRRGRRSEAFAALAQVQQAQERWRANNPSYASLSTLGLPATTSNGYYGITVTLVDATKASTYIATATAKSGTSQAKDANCLLLGARTQAGNLSYGGGATTIDWTDPNRCWPR
jgi:type IV pilus assembly protein PilE